MMSKYILRSTCIFGKYMQNNLPVMLSAISYPHNSLEQIRHINKHWNPKYKKERKEKFIKIDLPNFHETNKKKAAERKRSLLKQYGIYPQKQWTERPIFISCTPNAFDSYVPPEGDGKFSTITKAGAMQKMTDVTMKGKSMMAIRKIKSFEDTFTLKNFPQEALNIYIKAHEALAAKDMNALIEYVTESAYSKMLHNVMDKNIRWKYVESLEPPRIVHARCQHLITKDNLFGQLTMRIHSQQILTIYDRFGRLLKGSEILKKDVLEYIVYENHLANQYGKWRLHEKIIPSWMPPREVGEKTYILSPETEKVITPDLPNKSTDTTNAAETTAN
ncbi:probable 39S ribosomal protein L45, mitochondrial [Vespa velutina]|uniref:probable 39S ribosomal protein L45, mitochondrial n=1 Tax=Vespa velutina TaxID=202808 RepID=UPI001FB348A2|nr:probable 39S ribosomal protein L45, mitochondrial [Vespa velutina]